MVVWQIHLTLEGHWGSEDTRLMVGLGQGCSYLAEPGEYCWAATVVLAPEWYLEGSHQARNKKYPPK